MNNDLTIKPKKESKKDRNFKYGNENDCLKELFKFRMPKDGLCLNPLCRQPMLENYRRIKGRTSFGCRKCFNQVYPQAQSFFHGNKTSVKDNFDILFELLASRGGVSANEIARNYGLDPGVALTKVHEFRKWMGECSNFEYSEEASYEIDETYVRTGNHGLGKNYYRAKGRGTHNTPVLGIVQRNGPAKLIRVNSTDADALRPHLEMIPPTAKIYTDNNAVYTALRKELNWQNHFTVNHNNDDVIKKYVDGSASTNSCENIFSMLKRAVKGTYRNISEDKLQLYCNEIAFKHNFKDEADYGFLYLLTNLKSFSEMYNKRYYLN